MMGYVTFDAPKCQGALSRTLTYKAKKLFSTLPLFCNVGKVDLSSHPSSKTG